MGVRLKATVSVPSILSSAFNANRMAKILWGNFTTDRVSFPLQQFSEKRKEFSNPDPQSTCKKASAALQSPIALTKCQPGYVGSSILASKNLVDGKEATSLDAILKGNVTRRRKKRILPKHPPKDV
jgi:hypothetical protein